MRLKFRAYHIKTKQMFEVDEINHISSWNVHGLIGVNGIDHTIGISGEDCVLMQFTGLLDKNGQEISKSVLEGDTFSHFGFTKNVATVVRLPK